MKAQTAVVIGATGLIGGFVAEQLLQDSHFSIVRLLVRKPISLQHPKLQVCITDFNNLADFATQMGKGDTIFCCVGTTQQKVKGDSAAYRKVDVDIPLNAASIGVAAGFTKFMLVSSVGASTGSGNFYLQLKGEVEEKLQAFAFSVIGIFQPSMLLGPRKESRKGEAIGKLLAKIISPLLLGSLGKYKPIEAKQVAKAMVHAAVTAAPGIRFYQYQDLIKA